jgi:hypothetical protein
MRACLFALSLTMLSIGCTNSAEPAPEPKADAPPPSLKDLARAEIHEAMRKLVVETGALSDLLARSASPDPATHDAIVARVKAVDRVLAELDASAIAKTHPLLGEGLPTFRKDVGLSLTALGQTPPDYGPARGITQSCKGCHVVASRAMPTDLRFAQR